MDSKYIPKKWKIFRYGSFASLLILLLGAVLFISFNLQAIGPLSIIFFLASVWAIFGLSILTTIALAKRVSSLIGLILTPLASIPLMVVLSVLGAQCLTAVVGRPEAAATIGLYIVTAGIEMGLAFLINIIITIRFSRRKNNSTKSKK